MTNDEGILERKADRRQQDMLLTRRELAERWKVSIETLKRRERAGLLQPVRLDGRVLRIKRKST